MGSQDGLKKNRCIPRKDEIYTTKLKRSQSESQCLPLSGNNREHVSERRHSSEISSKRRPIPRKDEIYTTKLKRSQSDSQCLSLSGSNGEHVSERRHSSEISSKRGPSSESGGRRRHSSVCGRRRMNNNSGRKRHSREEGKTNSLISRGGRTVGDPASSQPPLLSRRKSDKRLTEGDTPLPLSDKRLKKRKDKRKTEKNTSTEQIGGEKSTVPLNSNNSTRGGNVGSSLSKKKTKKKHTEIEKLEREAKRIKCRKERAYEEYQVALRDFENYKREETIVQDQLNSLKKEQH